MVSNRKRKPSPGGGGRGPRLPTNLGGDGDKVVIYLSGKSVLYLISILAALSKVL
jgi:hypothetical protein